MLNQGGKWQLGAKMQPYIRGQKFHYLNQNKLPKKQAIHNTMKVVNILAVALGAITATSEAVKLDK